LDGKVKSEKTCVLKPTEGYNRRVTCAYGAATLTKEKSGSNIYPIPVK